ncbi:MAG: L-rhamnose mutarotase [Puniceicoccaceae bacterium]|nr:MAG: L-rhamnose mutarotase [Puniceicoccaceae bacterium]
MKIHPGSAEEYAHRHNPIWKELEDTLLDHGVSTYSIHLDPATGDLFAYAEIADPERWKAVADTAICRKWWDHMAPLMEVNPDNSPKATELKEVFHLKR